MRGIIPRAIQQIGASKEAMQSQGWVYDMQVSFVEIYCEKIKDLLRSFKDDDGAATAAGTLQHKVMTNDYGPSALCALTSIPAAPSRQRRISFADRQRAWSALL